MWRRIFPIGGISIAVLALCVGLYLGQAERGSVTQPDQPVSSALSAAQERLGGLPLIFEENRGQTDEQVRYFSRGERYTLFLTASEAVIALYKRETAANTGGAQRASVSVSTLRMKTVGSNPKAGVIGIDELAGKTNYFLGKDERHWQRDVPNYARVRYSQIYDNIDLVYYGNGRELEYDFVVQPFTDPAQIALAFDGADGMEIDGVGDLVLRVGGDEVRQRKPFAYQDIDGKRQEVAANYRLRDGQVSFELGEYDTSAPLVIDPVLAYGTYLGSREYEIVHGIAVDPAGNSYVTGYALPPTFPTTPGSVRPNISSDYLTPFVAKFNPSGTALVYSTYLGGAGEGIAVDAAGNAYTTGYPHPESFTMTPGALDMGRGGVGVTKLNPQGNQRIYAARFGSSGTDYSREIAIDPQGNAIVIGLAGCYTSCDFPVLNAAQPTPPTQGGGGFVAKLNASGSALIYSTYLGAGSEELWGVDTDPAGNAYVTGNTTSFNFPTTPGAFDRTFACPDPPFCNPDSFVTKIGPAGGPYVYSTYLGGRGAERGWSIAVDEAGNAYAAGYTDGRFSGFPAEGFPTTPGAFKMFGSVEAYVTKLNPEGSVLVYSTLLGGEGSSCGEERARDIDVDRLGHAYVVGLTTCSNFPVANALQGTPSSFQPEAFVTKFDPTGSTLVYSSYLGGPRYDEAYGVAVDGAGSAYVTGTTSGAFQHITPGAFDTTWNGANAEHPDDIFVVKITDQIGRTAFDFDGDAKADLSIFRPSPTNAQWWYQRSSDGGNRAFVFGTDADRIAPADFTGDGKTDIAFFRPASGQWFVLRSEDSSFYSFPFGVNGDYTIPADFDADGKADPAVFRPASATWYVNKSTGGTDIIGFGLAGDVPVAADYDGDAKADLAIYRPNASGGGQWWIRRSSNGSVFATVFGTLTDKTVQGDYTGDGKADIAFWRPATGSWFVLRSEDLSFYSFPFGTSGDMPVPGDYDGDGRADAAVFRPPSATWFVNKSAGGTLIQAFGSSGDTPVPSANVR
jgi:hypothetical protein